MEKMVNGLVEQMQKLNAAESHVMLNNIHKTDGLTAVISVYDKQKPSHMVLDELYEWAEENNEEVKELIEKLCNDMSWNKENRV